MSENATTNSKKLVFFFFSSQEIPIMEPTLLGRIMGKYMLFSARIMERDKGTDVCKRQLLRDGYIGLIGVL